MRGRRVASPMLPQTAEGSLRLNNRTVARLKLPAGKDDVIHFDDDLVGLGYRLRRSGDRVLRSWVCQYRAHGRTPRILIGSAEVLWPQQARAPAKKPAGAPARGHAPPAEDAAGRRRD